MKPADLRPGDRLDTAIGALVVQHEPYEAFDETGKTTEWDRVLIDVEVPEPGKFGDCDRLPEVTGATDFQWLGLMPLRYRLAFRPETDVEVTR